MSSPEAQAISEADAPELAKKVAKLRADKALLGHIRLEQAKLRLERSRKERPDIWSGAPLVSVRISTLNRPDLLVSRAIASVLQQTYPNFEVVIVGDGATPETAEAVAKVKDPRVRYYNLPARPRYANFPRFFWSTAGTYAVNTALDLCRGEWIAPLDDDDEFTPDHLEALLGAARQAEVEMLYGQMEVMESDAWVPRGSAPLAKGHICHGAVMYSAARLGGFRYDPYAWLEDDPGDWNLWKRMAAIGARIGFLPQKVGRHYPEYTGVVVSEERDRMFKRVATPAEILADAEWTGALAALELP